MVCVNFDLDEITDIFLCLAFNFSLDVNFICISNKFIEKLEKILKNFQITISQIVDARYINKFVSDEEENFFFRKIRIIFDLENLL